MYAAEFSGSTEHLSPKADAVVISSVTAGDPNGTGVVRLRRPTVRSRAPLPAAWRATDVGAPSEAELSRDRCYGWSLVDTHPPAVSRE